MGLKSKSPRSLLKSLFAAVGVITLSLWVLSSMSQADENDSNLFQPDKKSVSIWAWDRFDDLSFLKDGTSVTSYAGTFYLRDNRSIFDPRRKELICPKETARIPSFRIESVNKIDPDYEESAIAGICDTIKQYFRTHSECQKMVQIDFDARASERDLYKKLLVKLRQTLKSTQYTSDVKISITALASWCLKDKWMQNLDVDEIVIMLFSLGPDKEDVLTDLKDTNLDTGNKASTAIGISANETETNEALKILGIINDARKVYIFQSLPWTKNRYVAITDEVIAQ